MVGDVAYFLDRSTAYLCKIDTAFPFSVDVTMMCLASICVFTDRYLYSCPSECSAIPRLQGNHTSAQIRSFILDFKNPFDRRLVSICQGSSFYQIFVILGRNCLLDSMLHSQNFGCWIFKLHQNELFKVEICHLHFCRL